MYVCIHTCSVCALLMYGGLESISSNNNSVSLSLSLHFSLDVCLCVCVCVCVCVCIACYLNRSKGSSVLRQDWSEFGSPLEVLNQMAACHCSISWNKTDYERVYAHAPQFIMHFCTALQTITINFGGIFTGIALVASTAVVSLNNRLNQR